MTQAVLNREICYIKAVLSKRIIPLVHIIGVVMPKILTMDDEREVKLSISDVSKNLKK